jgi:hypothetical protein
MNEPASRAEPRIVKIVFRIVALLIDALLTRADAAAQRVTPEVAIVRPGYYA